MRETEFLTGLYKCFGLDVLTWVMGNDYENFKRRILAGQAAQVLREYLINARMEEKLEESIQKLIKMNVEVEQLKSYKKNFKKTERESTKNSTNQS